MVGYDPPIIAKSTVDVYNYRITGGIANGGI